MKESAGTDDSMALKSIVMTALMAIGLATDELLGGEHYFITFGP